MVTRTLSYTVPYIQELFIIVLALSREAKHAIRAAYALRPALGHLEAGDNFVLRLLAREVDLELYHLVVFPSASYLSAVRIDQTALAVLAILGEVAFVDAAILPHVPSFSAFLILRELTGICLSSS